MSLEVFLHAVFFIVMNAITQLCFFKYFVVKTQLPVQSYLNVLCVFNFNRFLTGGSSLVCISVHSFLFWDLVCIWVISEPGYNFHLKYFVTIRNPARSFNLLNLV